MTTPRKPAFSNMNELTQYLTALENRLATLETENRTLRNALGDMRQQVATRAFKTERTLPDTNIVSDSFFARAFAIWGHYFVAQLIIGIPIGICWTIVAVLLATSSAGF
jgi:hypothetical protein